MQHRAYVMRLKPEHLQDYIEVHRKEKIWDSILEGLRGAKVAQMIILLHGRDVIVFEEAQDLKAAYQSYDTDAETAKWDAMMDRWIENYPKFNEVKGDVELTELPVVFYYQDGKMLH